MKKDSDLGWGNLRSYQLEAASAILEQPRIALFMGLGLGKTITTLSAISVLEALGLVRRVLVIAPKSVAETVWHTEAAAWAHTRHLDFALCVGDRTRREAALRRKATITVTNVESIKWLAGMYPIDRNNNTSWPFDMVVFDESSLFKNPSSLRFKIMVGYTRREKTKRSGGLTPLVSPIRRSVLLTATPSANGLGNLWSQMVLLDDGAALGRSKTAFQATHFFNRIGASRYEKPRITDESRDRIYKKINHLVRVLRTTDYIDMPGLVYKDVVLTLTGKARAGYDELEQEFVLGIEGLGDIYAPNTVSLSNSLRQYCGGAAWLAQDETDASPRQWVEVHDVKVKALAELAETAESPMLVAYWYKHELVRLKKAFPKAVTLSDGGDRLATIERWNRGEIDMLLVQPASAGHGLNLQKGGSTLVWFSIIWDLELYDQLVGRLYRSGQRNTVTVVHLTIARSVEQKVVSALKKKANIQNHLLKALSRDNRSNSRGE